MEGDVEALVGDGFVGAGVEDADGDVRGWVGWGGGRGGLRWSDGGENDAEVG